ncbi:hypothetical protein CWI37_0623p0020 [Hamiltosporidium tvaerminnensis]|uniref:Uncharacterized protein n=1 Tax=Hamiltosporidium tvaerminnensis TaxID=1176355 RepID=A0A4Q9L5F1_9MICR|nr:hypothetical protein CWI37_0623p0020 [Hamiltosporidium tvaerminnensis]
MEIFYKIIALAFFLLNKIDTAVVETGTATPVVTSADTATAIPTATATPTAVSEKKEENAANPEGLSANPTTAQIGNTLDGKNAIKEGNSTTSKNATLGSNETCPENNGTSHDSSKKKNEKSNHHNDSADTNGKNDRSKDDKNVQRATFKRAELTLIS